MLCKVTLSVVLTLCLHIKVTLSVPASFCSKQRLTKTEGEIFLDPRRPFSINCNWTITPGEKTITTLTIIDISLNDCNSNKLILQWNNQSYEYCQPSRRSRLISITATSFTIILISRHEKARLWVEYKTRSSKECPNNAFQCYDKQGCFDYSHICDGKFKCKDHSDEVNCGLCGKATALCVPQYPQMCFSPTTQRCDGNIHCLNGADEYDCDVFCKYEIRCKGEAKCIPKSKICDGKVDCAEGTDESNCGALYCKYKDILPLWNDKCNDGTSSATIFSGFQLTVFAVMVVIVALSFVFAALVYRWFHGRRDIGGLLADMPEFPLPPFEGPGEDDEETNRLCTQQLSQEDFGLGGEIYEAYVQTRRRISSDSTAGKRKRMFNIPMSEPSSAPASPQLARNRSALSAVGGSCLSRDKTIASVVEDFYDDDYTLTVRYINEAFMADDKSVREPNEETSKKVSGLKKLFQKKRVRSASECGGQRDECDFNIFSAQ